MDLVLDQISRAERSKRVTEGHRRAGFGVLLAGAGIGILHVDPNLSSSEKREARVVGGGLLGLGGLFVHRELGDLFRT